MNQFSTATYENSRKHWLRMISAYFLGSCDVSSTIKIDICTQYIHGLRHFVTAVSSTRLFLWWKVKREMVTWVYRERCSNMSTQTDEQKLTRGAEENLLPCHGKQCIAQIWKKYRHQSFLLRSPFLFLTSGRPQHDLSSLLSNTLNENCYRAGGTMKVVRYDLSQYWNDRQ